MKRLLLALFVTLAAAAHAEGPPPTLFQLAGQTPAPARLATAALVVIDAQEEYRSGALPLKGIDAALSEGARLLARARAAGTPVVHVVHRGSGALFNPQGGGFAIVEPLAPIDGEPVVEKQLPDAFAGTALAETLRATGRRELILIGFMTHMCVSATAHTALNLGYATTVVAGATATRDLPDGAGGRVDAATLQSATLAGLADRFATVVARQSGIPE